MCLGAIRKMNRKKKGSGVSPGTTHHQDYSQIFNELETQLIIHRALLMQRLVQDPFYRLMNVSSPARLWMLRHLAHLADRTDNRYRINLMQFFEMMGHDDVLQFLRYKNAPNEMIEVWTSMYTSAPVSEDSDNSSTD